MNTAFTSLTQEHIKDLVDLIGDQWVSSSEADLIEYGSDQTEDLVFAPRVVVKPSCTLEVSQIMKYAYARGIAVVPVGARTGLSGGVLNVCHGIALSLERLNKIVHIDQDNLQVRTEPGVITQVLQEQVLEKGLFYPVDPASRGSCFIGGNVAENAGGARAVKYGVTKDYVLNLEVVLANGEVINTGADTLKNATGYNLTQLLVGSEGTLGIVTQIVLKLLSQVKHDVLMLIPFYHLDQAAQVVSEIFKAGIVPSAMEFMEKKAVDMAVDYLGQSPIKADSNIQAFLLVELDGNYPEVLFSEAQVIFELIENYEIAEVLYADSQSEKETLWKLRRAISEAVRAHSVFKEEDTVVPRFALPKLLLGVKQIGDTYGFKTVCYGHAGDGNLHINILKEDLTDKQWSQEVPKGIQEIFNLTVSLQGTLSGEHGIGWVQKEFMPIAFNTVELELMKRIKDSFDPKGILNPFKILPDTI